MKKNTILREIEKYNFKQKDGKIIKTLIWNGVYTNSMLKTNNIGKSKLASEAHKIQNNDEILLLIQNGLIETDIYDSADEINKQYDIIAGKSTGKTN